MSNSSIRVNKKEKERFLEMLASQTELKEFAQQIREQHYEKTITYSKNVFLPVMRLCRNNCAYCGFSREKKIPWLSIHQTSKMLDIAKKMGCKEALIVTGDKPETRYAKVRKYFENLGVKNTVQFSLLHTKIAIEKGFLPHLNLGVLKKQEWAEIKPFVASAGLMLETTSKELLEKGKPHYASPDKNPIVRIQSIEYALKQEIPFTTGILIGIGEKKEERIDSLLLIKELHKKHGFVQEVIIQPFHPLKNTPMKKYPSPGFLETLETVGLARIILPPKVSIQVPPNLIELNKLIELIYWGANDLGGISPVTKDYVNFEYPWPKIDRISKILTEHGFKLKERLPVYPKYYKYVGKEVNNILSEYIASIK